MTTNPKAKAIQGSATDAAMAEDETATRQEIAALGRATAELPVMDDVAATADTPADTADDALLDEAALDEADEGLAPTVAATPAVRAPQAPREELPAPLTPDSAPAVAEARAAIEDWTADEADEGAEEDTEEDDGDPTVIAQATPRPRTLSAMLKRPTEADAASSRADADVERLDAQAEGEELEEFDAFDELDAFSALDDSTDDIADEVDPEEEWALADQPTIYLPPRRQGAQSTPVPGGPGWAAPPAGRPVGPRLADVPGVRRFEPPPRRELGVPSRPAFQRGHPGPQLASPTGKAPVPPPPGVSPAALPDPRMQRFQRLREQIEAHGEGQRVPGDQRPVAEIVRQWWGDLLPGLRGGLRHQHEAMASGTHPVPAYAPEPQSRLGDAFGRLAKSARDLTDRARPALQRLHDQAEQAAQAIVGRFEQPMAVQQAPLLGPGRIAVFFRQGVTVGQAHGLLMKRQARPMRLIPRKHGFLAVVAPGREAEISEGLRAHPYVRDVAYIEYDGDEVHNPQAR
jgi:hypothetical protein